MQRVYVQIKSDRNFSIFLQTKGTHFKGMMTTVNEVKNDKTMVLDELIFRSASLVCFTAELEE